MNSEFQRKLAKVRALLKVNNAEAALIGKQSNFSWLSCGGEAHVALNTDRAAGQLLVTQKEAFFVANRIEMQRLLDEELRGLKIKPVVFDWHDDTDAVRHLKKIVEPREIISDTGNFGTRAVTDLFSPLRYSLEPEEVKRFQALGRDAEVAMNETCHKINRGQTEFKIAGELSAACWQRNLTPVVVLIAVDERIKKYRHPIPTKSKLKRCAMLVLCARRSGLIVSLTRLVHFGALPEELRRRHDAACAIDAAFIHATKVGVPVKEVFNRGIAAYAAQGFPDEWHLHHQGGPCGYETRDYVGSPSATGKVLPNQAFAWNPSITGTKSEDTILATKNGTEILTAAKNWPMVVIKLGNGKIFRPGILIR